MNAIEDKIRFEAARRLREPLWSFAPLPQSRGQQQFVQSLQHPEFGVYALLGGNRSGKSECGAYVTARRALIDVPRLMQDEGRRRGVIWVVYESYEMAGQIGWKQKLSKYIHERNIEVISWHSRTKGWPSYIQTKDGVEIVFKSWEQGREAFQGEAIDGTWFDEQFPADIFEEVRARASDHAAPVWITLTPIAPDPYLLERYNDVPPDWRWHEIDLNDNRVSRGGFIDDDVMDAMIAGFSEETRETRVSGRFAGFKGAIFRTFSRSVHVRDFGAEDISPDWLHVRGIDFGYRHPFCCLWGAQDPDGRWWIYDEHYEAMQSIEHHAAVIERKSRGNVIRRTWVDPGGDTMPTGAKDYLRSGRRGLTDAGIVWHNARKQLWESIDEIRRLFTVQADGEPSLFISSRCTNLIREIAAYRYDDSGGRVRSGPDQPIRKDDHAIAALRYLVWSEKPYTRAGHVDVPRVPGAARGMQR